MSKSLLSVVIPAHNEEGNIAALVGAVLATAKDLPCELELVIVDDGSTDLTYDVACAQRDHHANIAVVKLSRNFGHQPAILAGMRAARGDAIVTMDGDMQHPPALIKLLVDKWLAGFDVVHTKRIDTAGATRRSKSISSQGFYRLMQLMSDLPIESGMADFRLISRRALPALIDNSESRLFFRGLSLWVGFAQTTIEYKPEERHSGESSYSLKKMLSLAYSGILAFTARPLYWILPFGLIVSLMSLSFGVYAILIRFFSDEVISGWASLSVLISFLFGSLFIILGIMAAYLGAIHTQLKSRPRYLITDFRRSSFEEYQVAQQRNQRIEDF